MPSDLPLLAGSASTVIFAASTVPMVVKAVTTRDMRSYSLGSLALTNTGNAIHSIYVFSLPFGPIWILHGFYLVVTAFLLVWFLFLETRMFQSCDDVTRWLRPFVKKCHGNPERLLTVP